MSCKTGSSPVLLPNGNVHCIEDEPLLVGVGTVPSSAPWSPFEDDGGEVGVAGPFGMRGNVALRAPSRSALQQAARAMPSPGEQALRAHCKKYGGHIWKRADWYGWLLNKGFQVDTTTMTPITTQTPAITQSGSSSSNGGVPLISLEPRPENSQHNATFVPSTIAIFNDAGGVKYVSSPQGPIVVYGIWGQLVCTNITPSGTHGWSLPSGDPIEAVLNEFATDNEVGVAAPGYGSRASANAALRAPAARALQQAGALAPTAGEQAFRAHCKQMHGIVWKRADWYGYLLKKGFQVDTSSMMPIPTSGSPQLTPIYVFGDNGMSYVRHVAADPGILVYGIYGQLVCTNDPGLQLHGAYTTGIEVKEYVGLGSLAHRHVAVDAIGEPLCALGIEHAELTLDAAGHEVRVHVRQVAVDVLGRDATGQGERVATHRGSAPERCTHPHHLGEARLLGRAWAAGGDHIAELAHPPRLLGERIVGHGLLVLEGAAAEGEPGPRYITAHLHRTVGPDALQLELARHLDHLERGHPE